MSTPSGTLSVQIPNADGSITNLTASLADCAVTVTPAPPPPPVAIPEPTIPATATVVDMLPATVPWLMNHDAGTPGSASGTTAYPVAAPDGTICRRFQFTLSAGGGEIFHANVLKDSSAFDTFCYETVESSPDWSNVACAEKDLEQADATGAYVDMATQLDGHAGFVEVTESSKWVQTRVAANPAKRAANVWHTRRIYVRNLGGGKVLYIGILLDGTYYPLYITAASQPSAKWGANVLNLQLQYDGLSSGSVTTTVYLSVLRVHCWKS